MRNLNACRLELSDLRNDLSFDLLFIEPAGRRKAREAHKTIAELWLA
jgi:hypothetical protein